MYQVKVLEIISRFAVIKGKLKKSSVAENRCRFLYSGIKQETK